MAVAKAGTLGTSVLEVSLSPPLLPPTLMGRASLGVLLSGCWCSCFGVD